ncbi:MAG: SBBP repeat-containing protein [bacterium]
MTSCKFSLIAALALTIIIGCNRGGGANLSASDISGPSVIDEDAEVFFEVRVGGDAGYRFSWTCDPAWAGEFSDPDKGSTSFKANIMQEDVPTVILVSVSSTHGGPELRSLKVVIREAGIDGLTIGNPSGPGTVAEDGLGEFAIAAFGDTGIAFEWSCQPPGSGTFINPDQSSAIFKPGSVGADTNVKIIVAVKSDKYPQETRSTNLIIKNTIGLALGNIKGPLTVDEKVKVQYSVDANFDTGVTYKWSCDPVSAGTFEYENSPVTIFKAISVGGDMNVKISVTGTLGDDTPSISALDIVIKDVDILTVSKIFGSNGVDEESDYTQYSVAASGDPGIVYSWLVDPPSLGSFDDPFSDKVILKTPAVDSNINGKITVTVDSDNYPPIKKTIDITVTNLPEYVRTLTWGGYTDAYPFDVAVDSDDNVYVTGRTHGSQGGYIDLEPGPGVDLHQLPGHDDAFLNKFDSSGNYLWGRLWGGAKDDDAIGVAADNSGHVFVIGIFSDVVDFDPGPGVVEYVSNGYTDSYISEFDSAGNFIDVRVWQSSENYSDIYPSGIAADSSGDIFTVGLFSKTVDFNPGGGVNEKTSAGNKDVYLLKFDSELNYLWCSTWGGTYEDSVGGVSIDGSDNVYVAGSVWGTVDFDPGPGTDLQGPGYENDFVSKFNSWGNYKWARTWAKEYNDRTVYGIHADQSNNIWITGFFYGTVDFDPGPGIENRTAPKSKINAYLSKFDTWGNFRFVETWGGSATTKGLDLTSDSAGNIYVSGYCYQFVDFDPGEKIYERNTYGYYGAVSKFDSSGNFIFPILVYNGSYNNMPVAIDSDDSLYVASDFHGTIDFDPGPGVDERTAGKSEHKAFLLKLMN